MVAFETGLAWLNRAGFCSAAIEFSPLSHRVAGRRLVSFPTGSANRHVRNIARQMDDTSAGASSAVVALQALQRHEKLQNG
ncbi:MAG: hypothetical protein WDZ83_19440 [Rhizobiaceae bacterium]